MNLPSGAYQVNVGCGLLDTVGAHCRALGLSGSKVALVTDTTVAEHYGDQVYRSLEDSGYSTFLMQVPAGESSKSLNQFGRLIDEMIAAGLDRSSFVVALGGGVVGDLAGFVAASYYRGIPVVQIPTTIVAQVDSSIGGKTGINAKAGKNLIGAFHQPALVLVDPITLTTLPDREYQEGFAEVIKHAAIKSPQMLEQIPAALGAKRSELAGLIADNLAIKARIVEADTHERSGSRALLNFGHTLGHGIEASVAYGTLLHGEAIALGIRAALHLSVAKAGLKQSEMDTVVGLLKQFNLPTILPSSIETDKIIAKTAADKKFTNSRIKFVLLRGLGEAYVDDSLTEQDLIDAIDFLRSE